MPALPGLELSEAVDLVSDNRGVGWEEREGGEGRAGEKIEGEEGEKIMRMRVMRMRRARS